MADIDLKQGGNTAGLSIRPTAQPGIVSIRVTGKDAVAANGGNDLAANDTIQLMDLPAGTTVAYGTLNVRKADSGTTLTFDLGDATDADRWVDGADITTTGFKAQGTSGIFDQKILITSAASLQLTIATLTAAEDDWEMEALIEITDFTGNPRVAPAKDILN